MNTTAGTKIFYLKKKIIFPHCTMTVVLKSAVTAQSVTKGDRILAYPIRTMLDLIFCKNKIATLSEITEIKQEERHVKLVLRGLIRVRLVKIVKFQYADFTMIDEPATDAHESSTEELRKKTQELIFLINVDESDKLISLLTYIVNVNQMTDFISNYFLIKFRERRRVYNDLDLDRRIKKIIATLNRLIYKIKKKRGTNAL